MPPPVTAAAVSVVPAPQRNSEQTGRCLFERQRHGQGACAGVPHLEGDRVWLRRLLLLPAVFRKEFCVT